LIDIARRAIPIIISFGFYTIITELSLRDRSEFSFSKRDDFVENVYSYLHSGITRRIEIDAINCRKYYVIDRKMSRYNAGEERRDELREIMFHAKNVSG